MPIRYSSRPDASVRSEGHSVTANPNLQAVHQYQGADSSPSSAAADTHHDHDSMISWPLPLELAFWIALLLAARSRLLRAIADHSSLQKAKFTNEGQDRVSASCIAHFCHWLRQWTYSRSCYSWARNHGSGLLCSGSSTLRARRSLGRCRTVVVWCNLVAECIMTLGLSVNLCLLDSTSRHDSSMRCQRAWRHPLRHSSDETS